MNQLQRTLTTKDNAVREILFISEKIFNAIFFVRWDFNSR